jgi:competence protein ComEA
VHVTGQVTEPGVVELAVGDRVVDAVRAAGGFTTDADQSRLNLARPLVDGEQVWVGRPGEEPPLLAPLAGAAPGSSGGTAPTGEAATAAPLLDLNAANQAQLEELPGIGPVTAGRILAWRDEHERFSTVEELMEVSGIGERTFAQLEPVVTVAG